MHSVHARDPDSISPDYKQNPLLLFLDYFVCDRYLCKLEDAFAKSGGEVPKEMDGP